MANKKVDDKNFNNKTLKKIERDQPALLNNLLNKIIQIGEVSTNVIIEVLEDKTTPNEVKSPLACKVLQQVMDFLTINNKNKQGDK